MNDKIEKNSNRVKDELKALCAEYKLIFQRFRYVTLPGQKTRVPVGKQGMGFPDNNEFFHLIIALIEETYQKGSRICAYLTAAGIVGAGVYNIIGAAL